MIYLGHYFNKIYQMKRLFILGAALSVVALSMTSCSKERTCTCTSTYDGESETTTYVYDGGKKETKIVCEGSDVDLVSIDGEAYVEGETSSDYSYECELD